MSVELLNVPGRQTTPFYHHVSVASGERIIHVAGQVGSDDDLQLVEGGLAAQAEQALRNVVAAVEAAGATAADLVKLTMYVTDWTPDQLEALGAGLAAVEGVPRVPASLIGVSILFEPGYRIEIEAVAVA
ncbi:enamine deaminase RidA (YjgF/YER057c/UK114 family) [Solirubrobacter pauli]|uniref:Enamine deaminase RidA (YjgF/YER057c/UK114 family) n=1 Tax=Solirubrobacter pauli TaxID=166793 RepID=A0A660LA56_9ACTN|nr:RidA family protein [Solirubrobacter pauli]RKQ91882.1 enamine deaminase RidA (YjgF/YER057c/UK114 family) [Solirubrobacter pauli]